MLEKIKEISMVKRINELLTIRDELSEVSKKFDEHSALIRTFNGNVYDLRAEIDTLKESQNDLVRKLKEDSESIKATREELCKEINEFKLIRSRMERKLVEKFEDELRKELLPRFERLEKHVRGFEDLAGKVGIVASRTANLSSELNKFSEISQQIKAGDFELTKYAGQLKAMSNEKLELMNRINTLERLVGKLRRSSNQPPMQNMGSSFRP